MPTECIEDDDAVRWCREDVCRGYASGLFTCDPIHVMCVTNPDSGSCSSWSPASHITLSGGTRYVGGTWLAGLAANPAPLWTCDDAYLSGNVGAGFTVNSASSGEFLYQLGLRNGDRPLSVNGYPLDTWAETFLAYGSLYLSGETSYSVVVRRGTSNITFLYEIT